MISGRYLIEKRSVWVDVYSTVDDFVSRFSHHQLTTASDFLSKERPISSSISPRVLWLARIPLLISQVAGCVFTVELYHSSRATKRLITDATAAAYWTIVARESCYTATRNVIKEPLGFPRARSFNYISFHDVTCSCKGINNVLRIGRPGAIEKKARGWSSWERAKNIQLDENCVLSSGGKTYC